MAVDKDSVGDAPDEAAEGVFLGNGGGAVSANGKTFAVGLVWESINPLDGRPEALARAATKKQGGTFYCLRGKEQYGIGTRAVGHRGGMPSLAALIADVTEGSLVAAYETAGGYYLCAIRDDQILAGCDRLIADKQDAVDAFGELFYGSTWDVASAPADWQMDGTTVQSLDEAVVGIKPSVRLKDMSRRGLVLRAGVMLIGLAVALVAYQQFVDWQDARALDIQKTEAEAAQRRAIEAASKLPPPPPMPWEKKPQAVLSMARCVEAILSANIDVAGWRPDTLSCDGTSVAMRLKRDGGTLNWIGASLNRGNFKPQVSQSGDDGAVAVWPITPAPGYPDGVKTATLPEVRRHLVSNFEEIFQKIDLKAAENTPYYVGLVFSFHTSHDPREYAKILAPVPGMMLASVKLDYASWTWSIEGNVYEKLSPTAAAGTKLGAHPAAK